ncbi:hypothetical protein [Herbidospora daliensis]|uniref:hypothetical protein n=1 Tax=Herbidospora daliensis TaxID=295585 RepID=UPI0007823719|nr:hypothetical protein [Herbidospora daliensis]
MTADPFDGAPVGVRRLCAAADLVGYSVRGNWRHITAQQTLHAVLTDAWAEAGLPLDACTRQYNGDGGVFLMPADLDEPRFVSRLITALADRLAGENEAGADRWRLRLALHEGVVHEAVAGFAGQAVVRLVRLLDSAEVREVVRDSTADLVVVVSGPLYDDLVAGGYPGLDPAGFRYVSVVTKTGEYLDGWVHVPGRPVRDWLDLAFD